MNFVTGGYSLNQYYFNENKQLGQGGEGTVYPLENTDLCLKIYYKNKESYEKKIGYMCINPPIGEKINPEIRDILIWPIEPVYNERREFLGFVMKRVMESVELTALNTNRIPKGVVDKHIWLKDYERSYHDFYRRRIIICHNLASAINVLHSSGKYVMCDCKAQNIKLTQRGKIYIIDLDNIQIYDKAKRILFHSHTTTADIVPPEGFKRGFSLSEKIIAPDWDVFSFSTIAYSLLTGGPAFSGTHKDVSLTDQKDLVSRKLFPMGKNNKHFLKILPYHHTFNDLPEKIRDLFIQSFENKTRPHITEWQSEFKKEFDRIQKNPKAIKVKHSYYQFVKNEPLKKSLFKT